MLPATMPISAVPRHRPDDSRLQLFAQIHADIRVGSQEQRQHTWQELGDRGGVGQDTDMASDALRVFPQVVLQLLGMQQHQAAVVQERLAGRRQRHPTVTSIEQLGMRPELLDVLILRLAEGGVMFERWAPRVRLFSSATSTKSLMSIRSEFHGRIFTGKPAPPMANYRVTSVLADVGARNPRPGPGLEPAARARASPDEELRGVRIALEDVRGVFDAVRRRSAASTLAVDDIEPGALVDQELRDRDRSGAIDRAVERRLAVLVDVGRRRRRPPRDELDRFERLLVGARVSPGAQIPTPAAAISAVVPSRSSAPDRRRVARSRRISGRSTILAASRNGVAPIRFSMFRKPSLGSFCWRAFTSAPCCSSFLTRSRLSRLPVGTAPGMLTPVLGSGSTRL